MWHYSAGVTVTILLCPLSLSPSTIWLKLVISYISRRAFQLSPVRKSGVWGWGWRGQPKWNGLLLFSMWIYVCVFFCFCFFWVGWGGGAEACKSCSCCLRERRCHFASASCCLTLAYQSFVAARRVEIITVAFDDNGFVTAEECRSSFRVKPQSAREKLSLLSPEDILYFRLFLFLNFCPTFFFRPVAKSMVTTG